MLMGTDTMLPYGSGSVIPSGIPNAKPTAKFIPIKIQNFSILHPA